MIYFNPELLNRSRAEDEDAAEKAADECAAASAGSAIRLAAPFKKAKLA